MFYDDDDYDVHWEPYDYPSDDDYALSEDDIRDDCDSVYVCQKHLEELKSMRKEANWTNKKERYKFFRRFVDMIRYWKKHLPNLRDIFRSDEIDWLLTEAALNNVRGNYHGLLLIRFVIRTGYTDEPEVDEDGKPQLCRTTAVHWAARKDCYSIIPKLFKIYNRFDVNYIDESGLTHFHVACKYGFDDVVKEFLELGQDPNCIVKKTGDSPLHLVLNQNLPVEMLMELLLRHGADPNSGDEQESTPLHIICNRKSDDYLAKIFFDINDDIQQSIKVDALDNFGRTPLQYAVFRGHSAVVELLLRRGVDSNSTDKNGSTPLHFICHRKRNDDLAKVFFSVNDDLNQLVQVDAVDKLGRTPLHLALKYDLEGLIELLLRRGSNPNSADGDGSTPLHIICKKSFKRMEIFLKKFFKINEEIKQTIKIDVFDKFGRTPLQWAVANLSLEMVDMLLDRGADLSNFVFPTASFFAEIDPESYRNWSSCGLEIALRALAIVERLEEGGYELDRSDALTIMKSFVKHDFLKTLAFITSDNYLRKSFINDAKKIMFNSSLSLYDFIQLSRIEAIRSKLFTYTDYFKFKCSNEKFFYLYSECAYNLFNIMLGRFILQWTLEFFLTLTHYQLPIPCCEKIINQLTNEDLLNVCLAAEIVVSEESQNA